MGFIFYSSGLPQLCQVCQIPMGFTDMQGDVTEFTYRSAVYKDERYHTCSDGCMDIFNDEPEKYIQAWLPVHQIFQGNCGGPDLENVLTDYYHINHGADNFDYVDSPDKARWKTWKGIA